ncbi:hypothetical protein C8R44DRAFT_742476 [Mycena epipterygia]|nr:hypothetical protein C8R44DRAFT_742476 [Mycena epipterygia]
MEQGLREVAKSSYRFACPHYTRVETITLEGCADLPHYGQALDRIVDAAVVQLRHFERVEIKVNIQVAFTSFSAWAAVSGTSVVRIMAETRKFELSPPEVQQLLWRLLSSATIMELFG